MPPKTPCSALAPSQAPLRTFKFSHNFPLETDSSLTAVGFEPTPLRNGALSHRLRPLGQTVMLNVSESNLVICCPPIFLRRRSQRSRTSWALALLLVLYVRSSEAQRPRRSEVRGCRSRARVAKRRPLQTLFPCPALATAPPSALPAPDARARRPSTVGRSRRRKSAAQPHAEKCCQARLPFADAGVAPPVLPRTTQRPAAKIGPKRGGAGRPR